MRHALAGCAVILLLAAPAGAQTSAPNPAIPVPASAPAAHAKPQKPASAKAKAKPVAAAKPTPERGPASGQPDIRKWDELAMPAPKPKPGEAVWGTNQGGVRPTIGSGGGGMAIGF